MSAPQRKKQHQVRLARLEIIAQMYKRGHSMRQMQAEVMKRLDLQRYSLQTVHADVHYLLDEWQKSRIEDMDAALQLELERIDDTVRELWAQWEKSKEDYYRATKTKRGAPRKKKDGGGSDDGQGVEIYGVEESRTNVVGLGNPQYIAEIRQQLAERRKLLGLYAPEKKDISGGASFTSYLIESGLIDDAAQTTEPKDPELGS